ncbi:MAG: hypothetical protein LLG04_18495, partial [Parachlamydia sp.]|nr:hypothetical protein [Parachlamydia sp.]
MTSVTSLASDVRAALGTDLSKELQRLEPIKGKLGSRIIQAIQNEVNRFVNIFKTGKFATDSQVCVLLDKEVAKLSKLMKEEEALLKKKGTDESLVKQDISFRESVEALSGKMAEIVHKFAGKNHKPSKELLKLDKDLQKLHEQNHKEIEHDKKTLQNMEKLRARPEVEPRRRV